MRLPRPMAVTSRTIEEIEKSADIDAVIICTPTDTHADLIERFARGRQGDLLRKAGGSGR